MIIYTDKVNAGYNSVITLEGNGKLMQMDMGILKLPQGGNFELLEQDKETALLLLDGEAAFSYQGETKTGKRASFIDECPHCLHIPRNIKVTVNTKTGCEIYIQKALNAKDFTPVFYQPEDNRVNHTGKDILDDTMHRIVRTLFDFEHAPYSNMVLGEVLSLPGRWSGYIPHTHPQPEIYFYRFHRSEGFGAGFMGDNVYKLKNNSLLLIAPDKSHPQVTAPGFPMLTVWGIRHLEGNPWQRSKTPDVPEYKWIMEEKK